MEDNKVNSFTFYWDYYNLIDTMPIEDKKVLAVAILDYVFKDEIPSLNGHNQAIFNTLSKQLNLSKNNSKRSTGKKPEENQKANRKETKRATGEKPKSKPEQNKTSILSFKFYISNFNNLNSNELLRNKIEDWYNYKLERREPYKESGLKTLLAKIDKATNQYGVEKVIDLIDESMANGYKGIIWEKLEKKPNAKKYEEPVPNWLNNKSLNEKEERQYTDAELREIEAFERGTYEPEDF
jgi:CRISPR/Cas system CSM-associated protein Csm2 small subunit